MQPGPKNLITDVKGLRVGNAQDDTLKSGCTVVTRKNAVHCICECDGWRTGDAGNRPFSP